MSVAPFYSVSFGDFIIFSLPGNACNVVSLANFDVIQLEVQWVVFSSSREFVFFTGGKDAVLVMFSSASGSNFVGPSSCDYFVHIVPIPGVSAGPGQWGALTEFQFLGARDLPSGCSSLIVPSNGPPKRVASVLSSGVGALVYTSASRTL